MVILPCKDRLALFSKYLQQLVMESLGKEKDLDGKVVDRGIAVYGNKGSADQHACVQQLRDGVPNLFATFIEVREDRASDRFEVEPGVTSGDYLQGFLRGTRAALYEGERDSITLSIPRVDAFQVGALIALYEHAVGFYGSLVRVNAYHQPGVEAGKKSGNPDPAVAAQGAGPACRQGRNGRGDRTGDRRGTRGRLSRAPSSRGEQCIHRGRGRRAGERKIFADRVAFPASLPRFAAPAKPPRVAPMLPTEPNILWPEVRKFIGQLNHDLRNHLNAVELQAAFLSEIIEDPEAKQEIKRLREMSGEVGAHLQKLAASLGKVAPELMPYPATDFVEDLRAKLTLEEPEQAAGVEWNVHLGKEILEIDPQLMQEAFVELFRNAEAHGRAEGPLVFEARPVDKMVEFTLCEPKTQFNGTAENWGARPLQHVRSGHYGLGLFRARSIFEAHHGQHRVHFDPAASVLRSTVSFPARRES